MASEKRNQNRQSLDYPCWLDRGPDQPPTECRVRDVSQTGAKLIFEAVEQVPEEFILYLTREGTVGRKCKIAWREGAEIGLRFLTGKVPKPNWIDQVPTGLVVAV